MLTLEDVKTYKIPGLPKLEEHQIKFLVDILNGRRQDYAYEEHYLPIEKGKKRTSKNRSIADRASDIVNTKWFKQYKHAFDDIIKKRQEDETGWNLEMSIQERRKLYSLNLIEVDRLAKCYDKEIEYYQKKKEQAIDEDNDKKVEEYEDKILRAIRRKNMSIASNNACLQALEGLDKLCGLQTINLNHTGNVNFFGEDMWQDEDSESEQTN